MRCHSSRPGCYPKLGLKASQQAGFVLIVALLLMVALSFIGVSALRNVTLQERMASNQYYRTVALHESEGALRYARQVVQSTWQNDAIPSGNSTSSIALWSGLVSESSIAFFALAANWSGATAIASLLASRPLSAQYVVEVFNGDSPSADDKTVAKAYFFRATTRVVDPVTNASIVTQEWSTYPK